MAPTLRESLAHSAWATRGWTYHEYIFSRRLLIFTPSRAYFACAHDAVCEDTVHMTDVTQTSLAAQGGFRHALPCRGRGGLYAWIPESGVKKHVVSIVCADEQADEQGRWAEGKGRGAYAVPMRCVILSSATIAWAALRLDDPREVERVYDENEFEYRGKDEKLVYNIMWVRPPMSPATYMSRITVGQIHVDGWGLGQEHSEGEYLYG
ncbi:hypothetical protein B0T16DRAFT_505110 [Cercophora newfieldiana]|uniref:Heterokaryon incompatibility domain-containing protein n=1 Tax=Cercophora newfieldiana TaxID=92897 RepID=A0AA39YIF9_9PEZI|nr:hypothetical protein B0T16DRAFT_505110 [Cercophora newfieldiana]